MACGLMPLQRTSRRTIGMVVRLMTRTLGTRNPPCAFLFSTSSSTRPPRARWLFCHLPTGNKNQGREAHDWQDCSCAGSSTAPQPEFRVFCCAPGPTSLVDQLIFHIGDGSRQRRWRAARRREALHDQNRSGCGARCGITVAVHWYHQALALSPAVS